MKTTFKFGLGIGIAGAVLNLILFFAGFHDTPEKMQTSQWIGGILGLSISVGGVLLAMRARRAETPLDEDFGYGRALGTGTLTVLWSSLVGSVLQALYIGVINPNFQEIMVEGQIAKMEAQGVPSEQIDAAEKIMTMMGGPIPQALTVLIGGFIFGFIISLIVAIFVRREAVETFDSPPPLGS